MGSPTRPGLGERSPELGASDPPVVTFVRYDRGVLTTWWTPPPNDNGPALVTAEETQSGQSVSLQTSPWTSFVGFPAILTAGSAYTVYVTSFVGSRRVDSAPISLDLRLLSVESAITDPATGSIKLTWSPPDSGGTLIRLAVDGLGMEPELVSGGSVTWQQLPRSGVAAVTLARLTQSNGAEVTGPQGPVFVLPTAQPDLLEAHYDASTLQARWTSVVGATAHRVTLLNGGHGTFHTDIDAPATSVRVDAGAALTADSRVVVQALFGESSGPPSASLPVVPRFPQSLFVGQSALLPHGRSASEIELLLPELFSTTPDEFKDLPLGLQLTRVSDAPPSVWKLTVPASSPLWKFTDREDVPAAWRTVIDTLHDKNATPSGLATLTESVSRAVPQTFTESLFFAYGLEFSHGIVDLRPGLVLRFEFESIQTSFGDDKTALSGFVTSAGIDYEVVSYGAGLTGIDAFFAELTQERGVQVPPPGSNKNGQYGAGGGLDSFTQSMRLSFVRIVYPPTFLPPASPGSLGPQDNVVLLAAGSPAALNSATKEVRSGTAPTAAATLYFRGRTSIRAMVRVWVNGAPQLVSLGTTLGDLLAAAGRRPVAGGPVLGVSLQRARAAALSPGGPQTDWQIRIDQSSAESGALDIPLLHGDRIEFDGTSR